MQTVISDLLTSVTTYLAQHYRGRKLNESEKITSRNGDRKMKLLFIARMRCLQKI